MVLETAMQVLDHCASYRNGKKEAHLWEKNSLPGCGVPLTLALIKLGEGKDSYDKTHYTRRLPMKRASASSLMMVLVEAA